MHTSGNEAILITTASLSFAALLFLAVYLIYLEPEDAKKSKDEASATVAFDRDGQALFVGRPDFIARAIGHDKIQHLRAFRSFNHIFATLPTSYRIYRKRIAEEKASKARLVDVRNLQ